MLSDVISAAEMALTGGEAVASQELADLVGQLDLSQLVNDERTYLAALLDAVGLTELAIRALRSGAGVPDTDSDVATLRNLEAMLASRYGRYERAIELFSEALNHTSGGTLLRTKVLANLATVS